MPAMRRAATDAQPACRRRRPPASAAAAAPLLLVLLLAVCVAPASRWDMFM